MVDKKNRLFFAVFIEIHPKFCDFMNDFMNSDDHIGKFTSKSIRLKLVFIKKIKFEVNKNQFFFL